jgi:hypothetical protein
MMHVDVGWGMDRNCVAKHTDGSTADDGDFSLLEGRHCERERETVRFCRWVREENERVGRCFCQEREKERERERMGNEAESWQADDDVVVFVGTYLCLLECPGAQVGCDGAKAEERAAAVGSTSTRLDYHMGEM